ncbi:MAG: hypothetical protein JWQ82_1516, partial [Tardiphaga sp.]|nr:hypothetical protein [Tardiphaga sp.]
LGSNLGSDAGLILNTVGNLTSLVADIAAKGKPRKTDDAAKASPEKTTPEKNTTPARFRSGER